MPNINKVVFGNQTLIDLSTTTLSETSQLANGITAYDRAGNVITGTASGGGTGGIVYQDAEGYIHLSEDAANVISIVDELDAAGGTIRTITGAVGGGVDVDDLANRSWPSGAVTLDSATIIPRYCFENNSAITSITSSTVTDLREYAFNECSNLTTVYLPNLTVMRNGTGTGTNSNGYFFYNCNKLESVHLPNLENIYGNYAFAKNDLSVTNPPVIVLPKIQNLGVRAFRQRQTAAVDFGPDLVQILADTFYNGSCPIAIFRGSAVVPTVTADAIRDLRSVYVPQDLISSYQAATNWSTRYSAGYITFYAIEGSQYENYYADGTPIPTT